MYFSTQLSETILPRTSRKRDLYIAARSTIKYLEWPAGAVLCDTPQCSFNSEKYAEHWVTVAEMLLLLLCHDALMDKVWAHTLDCCFLRAPDATMLSASMDLSASLAASAQPQPLQGSSLAPMNISRIVLCEKVVTTVMQHTCAGNSPSHSCLASAAHIEDKSG